MLDVNKELKEYESITLEQGQEQDNTTYCNGLPQVIGSFTKVLERIGKEQFKFSQQLEAIFSMLEDDEEQSGDCREAQAENKKKEQEAPEELLRVLLELADSLEDVYRYALRSDQNAWREQLSLQWQKTGKQMEKYGIRRIEGAGDFFDSRLHAAREVKEYPGVSNGQILDVLKSGYLLEETILRKAEVVVNRFKE